jgi:hypothetical protein
MEPLTRTEALDRHALVMAVWLALGFVAAMLFGHGFRTGGNYFTIAGFIAIVAGFIGHIIVNAVYATRFSPRELALGLVIYAAALVAFGLATLLAPGFAAKNFLTLSLGLVAVGMVVVFYMITHFGLRGVFDAFDVIGDFRGARGGAAFREGDGR